MKLGVLSELGSSGLATIAVSGATVSTVQVREAGVGSGPSALLAVTVNVCEPCARPA